jgi:sec-independent protein translocase protein TatC
VQKFTLREHFLELKFRLIKIILFFVIAFLVSYYYSDNIYQFLLKPLFDNSSGERKVIYTGLAEAFITYLKLGAFVGFLSTIPVICWQVYFFLAPGLHKYEKHIIFFVLAFSPLLFFCGAGFVFYLVMPKAWQFFLSFENKNAILPLVLEARISEYLSLVMQLIVAFGLAFQMPVVMVILGVLGIVSSESLKKKEELR